MKYHFWILVIATLLFLWFSLIMNKLTGTIGSFEERVMIATDFCQRFLKIFAVYASIVVLVFGHALLGGIKHEP